MKYKILKLMITMAIFSLLITACGGAAPTEAPVAPALRAQP